MQAVPGKGLEGDNERGGLHARGFMQFCGGHHCLDDSLDPLSAKEQIPLASRLAAWDRSRCQEGLSGSGSSYLQAPSGFTAAQEDRIILAAVQRELANSFERSGK